MADERLMIGWQVAECRSPCAEPANMQRLAESQAGRYVMLCLEGLPCRGPAAPLQRVSSTVCRLLEAFIRGCDSALRIPV